MLPTLFEIPLFEGIPIRSFGVMVMLGFLIGLWYAMRLSRRFGADPENDPQRIADLSFWILLGIILGGRILYVMIHSEQYQDNPFRVLAFWEGGMVFYGGFLASLSLGIWKAKHYKLDLWKTGDVMMIGCMIGYGIGRWGCLLVGDDFGSPTDVPWALKVPDELPPDSAFYKIDETGNTVSLAGQSLHPSQLYMSMTGWIIAAIGRFALSRRRFAGQICWLVIGLYAIGRFINEMFRGDDIARGKYGSLFTSQWIAIGMLVVAGFMLWYLGKKNREAGSDLAVDDVAAAESSDQAE